MSGKPLSIFNNEGVIMNDQKGTLRLTTTMVLLVGVLGLLAAQQLAGRQRCQIEALKNNK